MHTQTRTPEPTTRARPTGYKRSQSAGARASRASVCCMPSSSNQRLANRFSVASMFLNPGGAQAQTRVEVASRKQGGEASAERLANDTKMSTKRQLATVETRKKETCSKPPLNPQIQC